MKAPSPEKSLIDAILDAYHTTRMAGVNAADHILSKPYVQKAFADFTASRTNSQDALIAELVRMGEALRKVEALPIVPIADKDAGAHNGKTLIQAHSIARQALATLAKVHPHVG